MFRPITFNKEECGTFLKARNKVARKTVDLIRAEIKLYNLTCEKGFEITIKDIINKFKQK